MRRSKVTLLVSRTYSVDFFMLSPYKPYNKPAFLALIPPSFTSLNPFVACFRPLQPRSSKGVWKSRKLESGIGTVMGTGTGTGTGTGNGDGNGTGTVM